MKIQLNQAWEDNGRVFKKYAVLEMSESEALALIAEGYGHRVPDDTRLFVSETLINECSPPQPPQGGETHVLPPLEGGLGGEFEKTGEELAIEDLTGGLIEGKTYSADEVKEAEKKRGKPFPIAGHK